MKRILARYENQEVGTIAISSRGIVFEYDSVFLSSGHELSPLNLPLGPGLRQRSAQQLPGLFEDSLPDAWGRRLMMEWFRREGVAEHTVTPLAMLAYIGPHGMGALTYEPEHNADPQDEEISLVRLQAAAARVETDGIVDLEMLASVGSSAGGARPKALLALPIDQSGPILSGVSRVPPTHEGWLVKFDTSRDGTEGPMEQAYALMAQAAGVDLPETRLLETHGVSGVRRHFAVKRFDRESDRRIHHHTLAGLCHIAGGDLDYQTFLRVTRRLTLDEEDVRKAFRRAVFNILAHNRDDHGKNHGFIYRDRQWSLGPAYDLTFMSPERMPERGMAIQGERRSADSSHLLNLAASEGLEHRAVLSVMEEVRAAVDRWCEFADGAGVPKVKAAEVATLLGQRRARG